MTAFNRPITRQIRQTAKRGTTAVVGGGNGLTVPGAPTIGTATAGNAQATVSFTAPGSNGGSAITSYTVTSSPGGFTASGAASPLTVTGLTNNTAYTFTVLATNAIGQGSASAASNSATPVAVNMLSNPSFVAGTGWTFDVGGNFTGDTANFTTVADQKLTHTPAITLTNGVSYIVTWTVSNWTTGAVYPQFTLSGGAPATSGNLVNGNGAKSDTLVASGNNSFRFVASAAGTDMTIDNVSVVPA